MNGTFLSLRQILSMAGSFVFITLLSGCLPQDVPMTSDPSKSGDGVSYSGFSGIESAETVNGTRVTIKWTPSTDPSVVAYNIYDATFRFNPKLLRTVTAPADQVTLNALANQSLYAFRVRAANKDNVEDNNTKDLQAIPYAGISGADVLSSTSVQLSFPDGSNSDEILVQCKMSHEEAFQTVETIRQTSRTSTVLQDLVPDTEYTCRVALSIDGFVDNNPTTQTFKPMGQADHLVFDTQPGNGAAGQPLSGQPVIRILDQNDNIVSGGPDATAVITLQLSNDSPTGGNVNGTVSVQAVAGVATFSGIYLEEAGQKIIRAIKQDTTFHSFGTPEMAVDSGTFLINPGPVSPDNSTIAISPAVPPAEPIVANGVESYQVAITLRDAFNNPIVGVKPTFASNVVGDSLTQPTQNTDASGMTTGSISSTIVDSAPNLRSLRIASPSGLSSVTTMAPMRHGTANKLGFKIQPVNSPAGLMGMAVIEVEVQDAQGNRVTTGSASTEEVTLSIAANVNGAILSGTPTKNFVAGVATFSDLGIDKTGNAYRLIASSGSLVPSYSNTFNVTAGVPKKIAMTGPSNVRSGVCSTAITIQLQDLGSNPTNAIQSTPVSLSGLGAGGLYSSSVCSGSPVGNSITFTAGTHTRTFYYKGNKSESLLVAASDTSSIMTAGSLALNVGPSKIGLIAQAPAPAAPGSPLRVVSGQCSEAITITPMGEDGTPGPNFIPTPLTVTGVTGTQASLFSDPSCTATLAPGNITLPVNTGPDFAFRIYAKGPKAESLTISVTENGGEWATTTTPQTVVITPSNIHMTGPTSVVAGFCSSVFTVQLRDAQGNPTLLGADRELTINGIPEASAGRFYYTAGCTGSGTRTSLTFSEGSDTLQVYFRSVQAEVLPISLSDPLGELSNSTTINLAISPSTLRLTAPVAGSAKTNVCAGPFVVDTLDGVGQVTNAITPITVDLTGAGVAGSFFLDSGCDNSTTEFVIGAGTSSRNFYFKGYYPEAGLTLSAADRDSILTTGTANWVVTAAKGWLGTASTRFGENGELWFRPVAKTVTARTDGIYTVSSLSFSPDYRYLYVADGDLHRVLKYDYQEQKYVGWIGAFLNVGGIGVEGSTLTTPSSAQCVSTLSGEVVPGWCVNGQSYAQGSTHRGGMYHPFDVKDDGVYVYVANHYGQTITRYDSQTGAFRGYLGGRVNSTTGLAAAENGPASCATTISGEVVPGWCLGGTLHNGADVNGSTTSIADGRLNRPMAMTFDDDYLYVLNRLKVNRYDKLTGAFAGWIGRVHTTPTGGTPGCDSLSLDDQTPGWCFGGIAKTHTGYTTGGMNSPREIIIKGSELIVFHSNGSNTRFDKETGAVIGNLPELNPNWHGFRQSTTDGTYYYFADLQRIVKTDADGLLLSWMGKVANNIAMSGNPGCNTLAINQNTPGWCLGGSSRPGTDAQSFRDLTAIAYDGNGKLIVGQSVASGTLRRFDATTGAYEGTLAFESISPKRWSNNPYLATERNGFDDDSMFNPSGIASWGNHLFVAEASSSRLKKFDRRSGDLLGWLGALTTSPTGGQAGCVGANPFAASPGWCLGANFLPQSLFWNTSMIASNAPGVMSVPNGVVADGTYVYVVDYDLARVMRFNIETGAPAGWIGRIAISPTGGDPGCNGATVGTFTPGWCTGGRSNAGTTYDVGSGFMLYPSGITLAGGNLYVVNTGNRVISSYSAATGAFNGWIGRVDAAPTSGCTTASNGDYTVSTSGWCLGGTSAQATTADRGGGFHFWTSWWNNSGGITTDGTHLYVANFYNRRIDKFNLNGELIAATRSRDDIYTNVWETDPATLASMGSGCGYPISLWTDGVHLYGVDAYPCARLGDAFSVWKMNLASGQIVGWQAGINPSNLPSDGDPGCAGATGSTPGWCRGGQKMLGLTMGSFSGVAGSITGDEHYVYVTDRVGNRVTRLPK